MCRSLRELSQAVGVVFTRETVNDVLSRGIENKGTWQHSSSEFFFPLFYIVSASLIPGSVRGTNHNNTVFLQDFNLVFVGDKKLKYFW